MFVAPRFPDPKDIIAAGGKVEGTSTEFHCVNGVCDGKVIASACCSSARLLFATTFRTSIPPLTRGRRASRGTCRVTHRLPPPTVDRRDVHWQAWASASAPAQSTPPRPPAGCSWCGHALGSAAVPASAQPRGVPAAQTDTRTHTLHSSCEPASAACGPPTESRAGVGAWMVRAGAPARRTKIRGKSRGSAARCSRWLADRRAGTLGRPARPDFTGR